MSLDDIYCSFHSRNRTIVNQVCDELKRAYSVGMDIASQHMTGNRDRFEDSSNAMRNSYIVICFISKDYCDSENCISEVAYARKLGKPCLFIILEKECSNAVEYLSASTLKLKAYIEQNASSQWSDRLYQQLFIAIDELLSRVKNDPVSNKIKPSKTITDAYDVYFSYNWKSKEIANQIFDRLQQRYTVWFDRNELYPGMHIYEEVGRAIKKCKIVLALVTKDYCESMNCESDVSYTRQLGKTFLFIILDRDYSSAIAYLSASSIRLNAYNEHNDANQWSNRLYQQLFSAIDHLLLKVDNRRNRVTPNTNVRDSYDIYISYNWKSREIANQIVERLQQQYSIWFDQNELIPGMKPFEEIATAIKKSKVILAFITKDYCESPNCESDLSYGRQQRKTCVCIQLERFESNTVAYLTATCTKINAFNATNEWSNQHHQQLLGTLSAIFDRNN